jgi:alkylation response protein AidB-like acyl-CoA dehydrogenase
MAIGISDAHVELAGVARSFLDGAKAHDAARALLDAPTEDLPAFWTGLAELGWLGLHVPDAYGGSGFGLLELFVVAEELGHAMAPGPFLPTVLTSATIAAHGDETQCGRWLPGLVDGTTPGALALRSTIVRAAGRRLDGEAVVLGGGLARVLAVVVDDDVVVLDPASPGLEVRTATSIDPTRRSAVVTLRDVAVADDQVLAGAARGALALARALTAAEAVGGARRCVEMATDYAKARQQFGRPIAMFQAVKHLCANMLVDAETATALVWEAGRAAGGGDPVQFELAAAIAAAQALPACVRNAERNIQVHGGIGFTWEHDGHVLLRRAVALSATVDAAEAQSEVARWWLDGVTRAHGLELPPEAEQYRAGARAMADELASLSGEALRARFIDTGYVQPHWPKPWGREAGALEQLVIDEEFARAGVTRPDYAITGWIILTLIQHGSEDQVERWVRPTLEGHLVWCQLFSEPDAGSDAAGIRTRAERVEGGWLLTGQKVWTSGAQISQRGLATVRTDPDKPKHAGISVMVIDMHAEGVEVRPLREATGNALFNEVFFDRVFVPDDDVVGPVDDGWKVARATLGNERVSIGGGSGAGPVADVVGAYRRQGDDDPALGRELGMLVTERQAIAAVNLRRVERAVVGSGPGPEGNVTKLLAAEHGQRSADFVRRVLGARSALMEGEGVAAGLPVLFTRALTIAGGTSEITRNQIGERILGLPRDPLIN